MARFGFGGRGPSTKRAAQQNTALEVFRVLRANLLVAIAELDNPCVVVTSATAGEGKTSTSVGVAQSFAAAGARVVLLDCDLRDPDAHVVLGAPGDFGLSDAL